MEESSSACLRRSWSLPSPTSSEDKKRNSIQRALTSSVSFGRFMSESLDWEKWSAFTHNRYLEEVEKYSRPGSVAEKKAYFEAHYKRRRAAALLEQQNGAATDFSQGNIETKDEDSSTFESDLARKDIYALAEKLKEGVVHNCGTVFPIGQGGCYDAEIERKLGDVEPKGVEQVTEPTAFVENLVESTNHPENDECLGDIVSNKEDKVCKKDACILLIPASSKEEKPRFSSSKLLKNGSTFKQGPDKQKMPAQLRNSDKTTLKSKNDARDSIHKRKSNSTSLHMSINFASCSGETQNATSPGLPKMANSRFIRAPVKKSGNSKLPQISTRASVSGVFGHHSATTQSANRMTNLHNESLSGSRVMGGKVQSLSTRSSNTLGLKERSSTVSSSFTFKSEERAAKRKEFFQKLEQKLKLNDSDKQQLHLKPQVKARSDLKYHTKTTKDAEIPLTMDSPSNLTKKSTAARPCSPKIKEKAAAKVQDNARRCYPNTKEKEAAKVLDNGSRPTWGFSNRIENSKDVRGKNNRPPIYSAKSFSKKIMSENASPNVQYV